MKTLYLDCLSGISGDMLVGALADGGVDQQVFHDAIAALALPHLTLDFQRESRQGISGIKFRVLVDNHSVGEANHHHHHHHHHDRPDATPHTHGRTYRDIRHIIESSATLPDAVRARALAVFSRIAVAEGRIHNKHPDDVHFHEVGAEDSIADIVCACAGLHALAPEQIFCSRLFEGSGSIHCAHGQYPLPSPATSEILRNIPLRQIDRNFEFITPTGAALVAEFASAFTPMPELNTSAIGYGLGTLDPSHHPNVLRIFLGEASPHATPHPTPDSENKTDQVALIEANLDDCTPEVAADACQRLLAQGALDVWLTPIIMKKGRPGFIISLLCDLASVHPLVDQLFRLVPTLGCRCTHTTRFVQARRSIAAQTPWGKVSVKIGEWDGKALVVSPEYEDCKKLSDLSGVAVRDIMASATSLASRSLDTAKPLEDSLKNPNL